MVIILLNTGNGKLSSNNVITTNKNYNNNNQVLNNYIQNHNAGQNLIISSYGTQVHNNNRNENSNLFIEIPFVFTDKQKKGKNHVSDIIGIIIFNMRISRASSSEN